MGSPNLRKVGHERDNENSIEQQPFTFWMERGGREERRSLGRRMNGSEEEDEGKEGRKEGGEVDNKKRLEG